MRNETGQSVTRVTVKTNIRYASTGNFMNSHGPRRRDRWSIARAKEGYPERAPRPGIHLLPDNFAMGSDPAKPDGGLLGTKFLKYFLAWMPLEYMKWQVTCIQAAGKAKYGETFLTGTYLCFITLLRYDARLTLARRRETRTLHRSFSSVAWVLVFHGVEPRLAEASLLGLKARSLEAHACVELGAPKRFVVARFRSDTRDVSLAGLR